MTGANVLWLGAGAAIAALVARSSVVTAQTATQPLAGTSRRFDDLFTRRGGGLPVAYLRALAKRESNLNPRSNEGAARGLLQITEIVRRGFNERHGTRFARADLLDAEVNVAIGADLLRRIIESYRRNHPKVRNLQEDWDNPRFVELLTFGWNAGYSERGGVGRVARYLRKRSIAVTIDSVSKHATAAGASRHLSNTKKVAWCKGVTLLYERERARDQRERRS